MEENTEIKIDWQHVETWSHIVKKTWQRLFKIVLKSKLYIIKDVLTS